MATIAEILAHSWPGAEWTIAGDDYDSLQWFTSTVTKPTEAEIRAFDSEVTAAIADRDKKDRQQRALDDAPDYLLRALETLIHGMAEIRRVVNDIRSTVVPAAHTGDFTAWDSDVVAKIVALRQKVTDLRNID